MRVDPLLALRVEAWRRGQAVPAFTHQRILRQPHALFLSALQFPGEDNTVLAAAIGDRAHRDPLRVIGTADPRLREEEAETIGRLHALLERYFVTCEATGVAPQLVLTSQASFRHLQHIADDLRFARHAPTTADFATNLSYFTMRADVPDQQAVVVMTDVLRTHWVPPLDPTQMEHLAALLAAIQPPAGMSVAEAVRLVEQRPMGARTTPQFDRDVLRPALERFHTARQRGAPREALNRLRDQAVRATLPVVQEMYAALHRACDLLDAAALEVLPEVPAWMATERAEFARFRAATAAGIRTPRMDKAKGGAFRYVEREEALTMVDAAVDCHDTFGRACGIARGAMVEGVVTDARRIAVPGQTQRALLVEVRTSQSALRVREGHELADRAEHRARFLVRSVRAEGRAGATTTVLLLQMTGGSRAIGAPPVGTTVTFVREVPDLQRLGRIRQALAQKLAMPHWTLGGPQPVVAPPGRAVGLPVDLPTSPLRALEVLR